MVAVLCRLIVGDAVTELGCPDSNAMVGCQDNGDLSVRLHCRKSGRSQDGWQNCSGVPAALVREMVKRIKWPWVEISGQVTKMLLSLYQQKKTRVDDQQVEGSHPHTQSQSRSQFPDLGRLSALEPSD